MKSDNDEKTSTHLVFFSPSGVKTFFSYLQQVYSSTTEIPIALLTNHLLTVIPNNPSSLTDFDHFEYLFFNRNIHIISIGNTTHLAFKEHQESFYKMMGLASLDPNIPKVNIGQILLNSQKISQLIKSMHDVCDTPSPNSVQEKINFFINSNK